MEKREVELFVNSYVSEAYKAQAKVREDGKTVDILSEEFVDGRVSLGSHPIERFVNIFKYTNGKEINIDNLSMNTTMTVVRQSVSGVVEAKYIKERNSWVVEEYGRRQMMTNRQFYICYKPLPDMRYASNVRGKRELKRIFGCEDLRFSGSVSNSRGERQLIWGTERNAEDNFIIVCDYINKNKVYTGTIMVESNGPVYNYYVGGLEVRVKLMGEVTLGLMETLKIVEDEVARGRSHLPLKILRVRLYGITGSVEGKEISI